MSLHTIKFSFPATGDVKLAKPFCHAGVVGSGDLEVLCELSDQNTVDVEITTPVSGFDHVWELVIKRFVQDTKLTNATLTINDNNATPAVVSQRLRQLVIR